MSRQTPAKGKKVTSQDLLTIKGVSDPQISPDGTKVAFVVNAADMEANRYRTNIMVVSTAGGKPEGITDDGLSNTPRWSPDGRSLAFISSKQGKKDLNLCSPDGSGRRALTTFESSNAYLQRAGDALAWSPDGQTIAFLATDTPKPDYTDIVVMERLIIKGLTEFMDFRRTHIFIVSTEDGRVKKVTSGDSDEHSINWTPNGKEIVFTSDRSGQGDLFVRNSIWAVNPATTEERRIVSTIGAAFSPKCSPDGKKIAYLATTRGDTSNDSVSEDSHLWVVNMDGKEARDLVGELNRPCFIHTWTPDGKRILFTAGDQGRLPLLSVAPEDGKPTTVAQGDWQIARMGGGVTVSKTGIVAFLKDQPSHPAEVCIMSTKGTDEKQLTDMNGDFVRAHVFSRPESFWFTTTDGLKAQGWLLKPSTFSPSKKYPVVLCVHGGPHGMFGFNFDERAQLFASAGYVVVMVDPRGSSGYGQNFGDGCILNWGGGDYRDLMEGLDSAISNNCFIDPERQLVTGGSYGGYMTNWIITQTDRFKAAVSRACVTNLLSFYGTSMKFSLIEQEFNGLPYDNLNLLAQWSPITHVRNVKTPTLFLHGEVDFTCPMGQAEEMYVALKRLGVDTQLVRYQEEGHGISKKPRNKADFYQRHLDWFAKHVRS